MKTPADSFIIHQTLDRCGDRFDPASKGLMRQPGTHVACNLHKAGYTFFRSQTGALIKVRNVPLGGSDDVQISSMGAKWADRSPVRETNHDNA